MARGFSAPTNAAPQVQFGSNGLNPLSQLFLFFESSYEPGFNLLSKILSNVFPRVAITRNATERKEVLFNEVTQGSTLFAALPVTSWIGQKLQSSLSGVPTALIKRENEAALIQTAGLSEKTFKPLLEAELQKASGQNREQVLYRLIDKLADPTQQGEIRALKLAKLGKSMGAGAMIAALLIATTYLRNYRTIMRTGYSDYKQVVGLEGQKPPTPEERHKAEAKMQWNLKVIQGLIAGGAAAWLGIMAGSGLIARKNTLKSLLNPERLNTLMRHWAFVGKRSNQIKGPFRPNFGTQTLMLWGIPSYLGWFLGCRDKYEAAEQTSKFSTFLVGYLMTPKLVKKWMARKGELTGESYRQILANHKVDGALTATGKRLLKFKQKQWATLMGLNILIAGVLPLGFNILFSKWRHQRDLKAHRQAAPSPASASKPPLIRRPGFEQWVSGQGLPL